MHDIDFTRLSRAGTYKITVSGGVAATSPTFRIAPARRSLDPLVSATITFFQAQRDGADIVPGPLGRKPSHLVDRRATVYDQPVFTGDGGDIPAEPLRSTGRIVDVEGGWSDAGDYLKFTAATSYSLAEMIYRLPTWPATGRWTRRSATACAGWTRSGTAQPRAVRRRSGSAPAARSSTSSATTTYGGCPRPTTRCETAPGDPQFFVKYRRSSRPPRRRVSPNLAGRVAAAFALGAQLAASRDPRLARDYLAEAASVFAHAKTTDVGELITAFPHAYYPETPGRTTWSSAPPSWRSPPAPGDRRGAGWCATPPTGPRPTSPRPPANR